MGFKRKECDASHAVHTVAEEQVVQPVNASEQTTVKTNRMKNTYKKEEQKKQKDIKESWIEVMQRTMQEEKQAKRQA